MKSLKNKLLIPVIAFALVSCGGTSENTEYASDEAAELTSSDKINVLTEKEAGEGWILLFDGETTNGWRGYNKETFPTNGWHIRDGALAVEHSGTEEEGFGGDVITNAKFENFELKFEFFVTAEGNSGVLYRVIEKEGEPIWYNAPEYQVLDDQAYIDMSGMEEVKTHLTAENYDLQSAPEDKILKPLGEWNEGKIIVDNNKVEHWLNGKMTVSYEFESPEWEEMVANSKFKDYPDFGRTKSGHIGLQDHGHLMMFRNIKIKKL